MANKREKSREQWQQEIVARQQNVTPADFPEGVHYARIGVPKIASQARFWIGIVLAATGLSAFRSVIPIALALAIVAGGLLLAVSAMQWREIH
jgi:hypothetical protein